jgi:hypothetical protein
MATVFGAIWTAVWAVGQWRQEATWRRQDQQKELETRRAELAQREIELRWKQAGLAREMLDEIFDYGPSNNAWRMVDGEEDYSDDKGNSYRIDMNLVRRALPQPWNDDCGGPDVYVRWCFDALLYYLERLEQSLQIAIVRLDDLAAGVTYYIALMAKDKKLFRDYAKLICFNGAIAFMERFPEWREAPLVPKSNP